MDFTTILANLIGLAGLAIAGYYLVRPGVIPESLSSSDSMRATFVSLYRRRRVTAALMCVVAVLFLVGMNFLDDLPPVATIVLWMTVMTLLLVVLILAYLDLRTLMKIRDDLQDRVEQRTRDMLGIRGDDDEGA